MNKSASVSLDWHPYKMNGYLHAVLWNINYFYGSSSDFCKVMVPVPVPTFEKVMVPVPASTFEKLRFRFRFQFQLHI